MARTQAKISIALCTYNGAQYLHEQLRSIATQTLSPVELVICDDCSTDSTQGLLRSFAHEAPFTVRVFSNETRLGSTKNFEKAIALCSGDVIVLADQDDVWRTEKLDRLATVLEQDPSAYYAFSDADLIDQAGNATGISLWEALGFQKRLSDFSHDGGQLSVLLKRNAVTGAALAFRASLRDTIIPIPSDWVHDHWIALLGSALFHGVPVVERLFKYRQHPSQLIGVAKGSFLQECGDSCGTTKDDCWRKVRHFDKFADRILSVSPVHECSQLNMETLKEKRIHLLARATIRSSAGFPKVSRTFREMMTGRYSRFSQSWRSVARDLVYD